MSKDKEKKEDEPLPEPRIQTDEDFDAFIALCETEEGWDVCFDEKGTLQSIYYFHYLLCVVSCLSCSCQVILLLV
jgi:hypothetical protein